MKTADFVYDIEVIDPDTHGSVSVAMYKDRESGAIFGVDASYILTLSAGDPVFNPFNGEEIYLMGD